MTTQRSNPRRDFLKTCLLGTSAALAAKALPAAAPRPAAKFNARVSLTTGEDRANLAFQALEPFKKEIADAIGTSRVILKPNNVMIGQPLCASHADNLEGILEFLKSIGKTDVAIAESPASGSALDGFSSYGYTKFAGKYGVKLINLDTGGFTVLQCIDQKDSQPHACRVSKLLLDPNNFVISAAKLKTHELVGVTLSLKNIVVGAAIKEAGGFLGLGSKSDKPLIHGGGTRGINQNLFTLSQRLHPHLAVIDGYEGMEGNGPINGTPVKHRVCVASLDWLAADRVGAALMGVDNSNIGYLTYCTKAGDRGEGDLSKIEIVGPALKDHVKTYKMPRTWNQIISWQKPA